MSFDAPAEAHSVDMACTESVGGETDNHVDSLLMHLDKYEPAGPFAALAVVKHAIQAAPVLVPLGKAMVDQDIASYVA